MRRLQTVTPFLVILLLLAGAANGQDPTAPAQNPAPVGDVEINGGYAFEVRGVKGDSSYYRVNYNGQTLADAGTPVKFASGLDLTAPATAATGDRPEVMLRIENGLATLGGTLFEADGARPLELSGLDKLNLRGTANISGKTSGGPYNVAVGLESPPLRLPGLSNKQYSNWLVFGVNGEHQENVDSPNDPDFGLGTYRAFVGKAFGWHPSADIGKTAAGIERNFLDQAPTLAKAKADAEKITKEIAANKRSALQQLFLDTVTENGDDAAKWENTVKAMARGHAEAMLDQPTVSFYAESSGWYTFRGGDKREFKNLLTITLDYWPMKSRDDTLIRARYENGYERASPAEHKNHVLLSAVFRF